MILHPAAPAFRRCAGTRSRSTSAGANLESGQIDRRGGLALGVAAPANPNIVTWNPANFGAGIRGGFFSVQLPVHEHVPELGEDLDGRLEPRHVHAAGGLGFRDLLWRG